MHYKNNKKNVALGFPFCLFNTASANSVLLPGSLAVSSRRLLLKHTCKGRVWPHPLYCSPTLFIDCSKYFRLLQLQTGGFPSCPCVLSNFPSVQRPCVFGTSQCSLVLSPDLSKSAPLSCFSYQRLILMGLLIEMFCETGPLGDPQNLMELQHNPSKR